ncbi:MAG: hypothetical protein JJ932_14805 [Balneolaceae bacterium]|nr:hypothetical protein [Balneolaceae bacterium]MBO6649060.1 hypothetical protein [Balneolaceae bacterium]
MHPESNKIELDITSHPGGNYEVTSSNIEGFSVTSASILEAIYKAISASNEKAEIN